MSPNRSMTDAYWEAVEIMKTFVWAEEWWQSDDAPATATASGVDEKSDVPVDVLTKRSELRDLLQRAKEKSEELSAAKAEYLDLDEV